jgi:fumarate reductase flavoprotein subunit
MRGQKGIDRRSFIKRAALMGGTLGAGAILGGCSSPSNERVGSGESTANSAVDSAIQTDSVLGKASVAESEFKTLPVEKEAETLDYDVVVIGGGTSGTCAALSAAENGARVLMLEKSDTTGGLSNVSMQINGAGSQLQKDIGREISPDECYVIMRDHYKQTNNLSLVREIQDASGENIDWLSNNGVGLIPMPEDLVLQPGLPRITETSTHMMVGEDKLKPLFEAYSNTYGGEVMLNTRAIRLFASEDGASVTGVACQKEDGSQILLNAKAIILAAGSWSGATDYFRDVVAHTEHFAVHSETGVSLENVGDGVYLAESIGAQRWISMPHWHQIDYANLDGTPNIAVSNQYMDQTLRYDANLIWVNSEGTRFCDESVSGTFAQRGSAAFCQGGDLWLIFDQAALEDIETNGSKPSVPPINAFPPNSGTLKQVEDWVADGLAYRADSLKELAKLTGFVPEEFQRTVDTYNTAVAEQNDRLYLKKADFLSYPISTAPFYAQRLIANNEGGALGGVRVNRDLKVYIKETGQVFNNLFATGLNAAGYFGLGPYVDLSGATMGFATGSGRLAGKHAAELTKVG